MIGSEVAAAGTAFGSAGCFAVSTSLQHRTSSTAPAGADKAVGLLSYLARQPLWLLGTAAGVCGLALHALALHLGAIALVQPLMASGLVLALPVRAALDRRAPAPRNLAWATTVATGLALFLIVADPTPGAAPADQAAAALLVLAGATIAQGLTGAAARASTGRNAALLLGAAAGVLFGLVAGLTKMATAALASRGPVGLLVSWQAYALFALGGWAFALNQRAYQSAPLSVSMPVLNVISPLGAIGFGRLVFRERISDQPWDIALELLSLALVVAGMVQLARTTTPTGHGTPTTGAERALASEHA
ncbi:multidrug transporter EmrE-like cation transporter [Streptacidiphilus sp. MAP12-20]|uniref:DMT family transporter n=1 Tax=Streptacidiphilus sp. MAP12-20 TaxID=3156299 RepID=UPI0035198CFB